MNPHADGVIDPAAPRAIIAVTIALAVAWVWMFIRKS